MTDNPPNNDKSSDEIKELDQPPWSVYLIETNAGQLYCGITNNVARRFAQHDGQTKQCARFLRGKTPLQLRYSVALGAKSIALKSEYRIKRWPTRRKWQMIDEQWSANRLLTQCGLKTEENLNNDK